MTEPEPNQRGVLAALKGGKPDKPAQAQPAPMIQGTFSLLGDEARPAFVAVPPDINELELLGLVHALIGFGDQLRRQRPAAGLVVARALPRVD